MEKYQGCTITYKLLIVIHITIQKTLKHVLNWRIWVNFSCWRRLVLQIQYIFFR